MKQIFTPTTTLCIVIFFIFTLCFIFSGITAAQESDAVLPESQSPPVSEDAPEETAGVADADNPGMGLLDQATTAKLRASTILDLSQVISLCQRAKKTGLSGENLTYCNQLLASCFLQRGLFYAEQLLGAPSPREGWQEIRRKTLADLEEAILVIKDQPMAFLRIAQLNLLPGGDMNKAKDSLYSTIQTGQDEPQLQTQAYRLLTELEPDVEKRLAVIAAAAKHGNPRIMFLHALTLLELKRNTEAAQVLQRVVGADNENFELHDSTIAVLSDIREFQLAMDILNMLRENATGPRQNQIDLMRAELFAKMKQNEDALKLISSLVDKNRERENEELFILAMLLRSAIHLDMENPQSALEDIEQAEKTRPDFPPIFDQKFVVLFELKRFDDALAVAQKLQTLSERPQNFIREVLVLQEMKQYDEAAAVINKLIEKFPEDTQQWTMLLVEVYIEHDTDKALTLVKEQLAEQPDAIRWVLAQARVLAKQNKIDEAVDCLESCVQDNPDLLEIQLSLLGILFDAKRYKEARIRVQALLTKEPNNLTFLRFESQLAISLGLHVDAVRALTKIVEADPEDYTSVNNLAWILSTSPIDSVRNGRRAVELAEKAAELTNFKRAFVLSTLAAAHAEAGDFEKAREVAKKSVEVAKAEKYKTDEERQELLDHLQKEWECFSKDLPFRELLGGEE